MDLGKFDFELPQNLGGGFKYFLMFTPDPWGNDPILTFAYFSNGLVQPPTSNQLLDENPW